LQILTRINFSRRELLFSLPATKNTVKRVTTTFVCDLGEALKVVLTNLEKGGRSPTVSTHLEWHVQPVSLDSGQLLVHKHTHTHQCENKKPMKTLSVLTTIFQLNLGQPVFIEAKVDGGGEWWQLDYGSYVVQSSSQIITTNKPSSSFFTGRLPFL